jgi:hypothetical protein
MTAERSERIPYADPTLGNLVERARSFRGRENRTVTAYYTASHRANRAFLKLLRPAPPLSVEALLARARRWSAWQRPLLGLWLTLWAVAPLVAWRAQDDVRAAYVAVVFLLAGGQAARLAARHAASQRRFAVGLEEWTEYLHLLRVPVADVWRDDLVDFAERLSPARQAVPYRRCIAAENEAFLEAARQQPILHLSQVLPECRRAWRQTTRLAWWRAGAAFFLANAGLLLLGLTSHHMVAAGALLTALLAGARAAVDLLRPRRRSRLAWQAADWMQYLADERGPATRAA